MTRKTIVGVCVWLVLCGRAGAVEWVAVDSLAVGGRFEYATLIDRDAVPFVWNAAGRSAVDVTRLMLDLTADTRYGNLYLKGSAIWDDTRQGDIQKRFRFDQGDYLWEQKLRRWRYSMRLFAGERRFFSHDMIAPLLDDDPIGRYDDNLGVRFDTTVDRFKVTALFSSLGERRADARNIGFFKSGYSGRSVAVGGSYLIDHRGVNADSNHAVFKTEVSASYKKGYVVLAYEQSGCDDRSVFFPGGRFDWDKYEGDNVSGLLPNAAAMFAEGRISSLPIGRTGRVRLVYRYTLVGSEFFNDLGLLVGSQIRNTAAAYYVDTEVNVNARLVYNSIARLEFENSRTDKWDGGLWGTFRNGTEFLIRGSMRETDGVPYDDKGSLVHLALHHQLSKIKGGVHVLWRDIDTIFSATRFAWDGKFALSPNWGFYWRLVLSDQFDAGRTTYVRLAYRPSDRIFVTAGYGRSVIGDGPYLLEDGDIELSRFDSAVYRISLRGDF